MRRIIYQNYWASRKKIQSEDASISAWDNYNKTKYLHSFEKGNITLEEIAYKNHVAGLHYEVIILEDEKPAYYIVFVHKNKFVGVSFLDNSGREYLTYHFDEVEACKKLFLEEIWYNEYLDDETENMDYYLHFVFDREGNAAYRKYDEIAKKTIDYESSQPFDVSGLYEDYPEFGKYENLIKLERNIDILNDFIKK
ncbi:MAG: hypothetical protein LBG80_09625 [Bacteroidales bacterium]|jgi:hypothetical protein|nr:hypothetical protein [Bacteroidales bacterium]